MAEIFATADIFTFPSSFETFGNVVLESFASGVPVVGVNQGGVVTQIRHGENGYLASPKDASSFASHIEILISDEVRRCEFGQAGRLYAKSKSWNSVFDHLIETFTSVIKDNNMYVEEGEEVLRMGKKQMEEIAG